jgi:hypothetical protein
MMTASGQRDRGTYYLRNQVGDIDEKHHKKPQPASGDHNGNLEYDQTRCVPSAPSENEASRDGRGTHPNVETNTLCEAKNDRA